MADEFDLDVLADSFTEFLDAEWPREKAIAYERSGETHDAALWDAMAGLGWPALTVPEAAGGLGLGIAAAARLHVALGAAVVPAPLLGTLLATTLLGAAGGEAADGLLGGIADGSLRVAVAEPDAPPLDLADGRVSGIAADVLDAPAANLLLLRARSGGQPCWIAVDAAAAGVSIERHALADTSRSLGDVILRDHPVDAARVIRPADPGEVDAQLMRHACIALAADSLGAGRAVLAATIDYLKVREQFGRVIGSFQALKHRVANHHTALVAAQDLTMDAAERPAGDPEALLAALSAKQHVTRVAAEIARDCIQLHGGVGFTSEYVPHLYLKRTKLDEALFGTRIALLDRIADMLEAA